jgi:hypothetical protein
MLLERDCNTSKGVGWATVVNQALSQELGISRHTLKQGYHNILSVKHLVSAFGEGVIYLFPSAATHQ